MTTAEAFKKARQLLATLAESTIPTEIAIKSLMLNPIEEDMIRIALRKLAVDLRAPVHPIDFRARARAIVLDFAKWVTSDSEAD